MLIFFFHCILFYLCVPLSHLGKLRDKKRPSTGDIYNQMGNPAFPLPPEPPGKYQTSHLTKSFFLSRRTLRNSRRLQRGRGSAESKDSGNGRYAENSDSEPDYPLLYFSSIRKTAENLFILPAKKGVFLFPPILTLYIVLFP